MKILRGILIAVVAIAVFAMMYGTIGKVVLDVICPGFDNLYKTFIP